MARHRLVGRTDAAETRTLPREVNAAGDDEEGHPEPRTDQDGRVLARSRGMLKETVSEAVCSLRDEKTMTITASNG